MQCGTWYRIQCRQPLRGNCLRAGAELVQASICKGAMDSRDWFQPITLELGMVSTFNSSRSRAGVSYAPEHGTCVFWAKCTDAHCPGSAVHKPSLYSPSKAPAYGSTTTLPCVWLCCATFVMLSFPGRQPAGADGRLVPWRHAVCEFILLKGGLS